MWLSSICLHAVCVCVCVSVQKPLWFCIFTCNLLCGLLFFFFFFRLKHSTWGWLLHSLSVDEYGHPESRVKRSFWKAPVQPSYLLISSDRGQGVRQGRAVACWHWGAQGPTHRHTCRLRSCVISSQTAAKCLCRSHTMVYYRSCEDPVYTQIHTL